MLIQKFGGTSVGSPQRMRELAKLTLQHSKNNGIVVLSAVAGTTNKLVAISEALSQNDLVETQHLITRLQQEYINFASQLFRTQPFLEKAHGVLHQSFDLLYALLSEDWSAENEKVVLAQGEILSTKLFQLYLSSIGVEAQLLNALDFMRTDANGEPDLSLTRSLLQKTMATLPQNNYLITQGYICRNHEGKIDNLQRGGSDYSATILGAALNAVEVIIWTDIDGMHNNDPRIVENTMPVRKISYREAAELAYFGAKILHPTCIIPTEKSNVPVRLKCTFNPDAEGTFISSESSGKSVAAIAAKDKITYIRITSDRMMNAYGFLKNVFTVFEEYKTSIDMVTTSEVSVSMSIENTQQLEEINHALSRRGQVEVYTDQSIICVVGDKLGLERGVGANVLRAFEDIPINMISYGGSVNNISILIDSAYKSIALNNLQNQLFRAYVGA